jgi:adenine-specific DNA-methyltransferase
VLDWTYSGNKLHPTQKPLPVLLPLVDTFSPYGGLVLDPFAGSRSTLLAARMLGRQYLGIELDGEYHAIAKRRMERENMTPATVARHVQHAHAAPVIDDF